MTPRLRKDPDMVFFESRLQGRPEGRSYVLAWREQDHCLRQLRLAISVRDNARAIARWRRAYIKATESCSDRLRALESAHRWPAA